MSSLYELSKEYLDLLSSEESDEEERDNEGEYFILDDDDLIRLAKLKELNSDLNDALSYPNGDGEFIHDGEWKAYVREQCHMLGYVEPGTWADDHIDWDAVAEEWESDYETVEFDGDTYYWKDSHG